MRIGARFGSVYRLRTHCDLVGALLRRKSPHRYVNCAVWSNNSPANHRSAPKGYQDPHFYVISDFLFLISPTNHWTEGRDSVVEVPRRHC